MQVLQRLISAVTALVLALAFVGLGLGACLLPPVTHTLANTFADDVVSPFDRTQLVRVADATRDYSFGSHSQLALYQVVYQVDREYQDSIEESGGKVASGFPKLDAVTDESNLEQLRYAFASASEMYCYSPDTVSHLDDCHSVMAVASPLLIACAILAVGGLIACGFMGKKRLVGGVLGASGIVVVASLAALGIWAAVDFNGFFASFHQLFFSQGNWTFPYDSLLICALPTGFWMGMAVVWLAVSVLVSILSFVIGKKLR